MAASKPTVKKSQQNPQYAIYIAHTLIQQWWGVMLLYTYGFTLGVSVYEFIHIQKFTPKGVDSMNLNIRS